MKSFLFAALATASLLASTNAFAAAPINDHDRDGRYEQGPGQRRDDNYGYDRNHRVTREEIARYQAQHRNDNRGGRANDRRDWERSHNYGYAQNHRITAQERARWEAQYRR